MMFGEEFMMIQLNVENMLDVISTFAYFINTSALLSENMNGEERREFFE